MNTPLLKIRDLCIDFPAGGPWGEKIRVIDHVDFAVAPGEVRGLVGESGCGKTTLARCSVGLLEPSSGAVCFDGINLKNLSGSELRRNRCEFQMIFQDTYASLNPAMSIEEILLEPLHIHAVGSREDRRERILSLMEAVSLDKSLLSRKPAELSGGQQQRVGIARSLVLQPRLLIADEPVSALDVSVQAQILNLLSELKKKYELTLILISHSLYVIHYLCTHISVMYRGRIVEEAPSAIFFKKPKHPYSRILLDSMPAMDSPGKSRVNIPKQDIGLGRLSQSGCAFLPNCPWSSQICGDRIPSLTEVAPGEMVACFLYR